MEHILSTISHVCGLFGLKIKQQLIFRGLLDAEDFPMQAFLKQARARSVGMAGPSKVATVKGQKTTEHDKDPRKTYWYLGIWNFLCVGA